MSANTPETITIDCTTGTVDANAPAEVAAAYIRADVAQKWVAERDAEIDRLIALQETWSREVNRLRELHGKACEIAAEYRERAEQPRTDAEWKAADRRKRINDLAARYAGHGMDCVLRYSTAHEMAKIAAAARALAAAVVEAEE